MKSTTTENLIHLNQRINERTKSGMSVLQWCKSNDIIKNKYHYCNHKISKKQESDSEIAFAEITQILPNAEETVPNSDKSHDFQIFPKNIQVTIPSNFNQTSLAGLMKVL